MEASCSGLHAPISSAENFAHQLHRSATFIRISFRSNAHRNRVAKARASLCSEGGGPEKRPNAVLWRRSGRQRRRNLAFASPQVEVIAQGEVADVEEIEGIRVNTDEQNRPMVEYLIKWKVRDK